MKIILSRKGYDSAAGGIPSPIFPDGSFCSIPIPSDQMPQLKDIAFQDTNLGSLVRQLTQDPHAGDIGVHLDPDLDWAARPRKPGWHPCFGQAGASQTHLSNQHVGEGDLFLFFGWFRRVMHVCGQLRYDPDAQDIHALFGWLQVGSVYYPSRDSRSIPVWAVEHPHVRDSDCFLAGATNNALYVASDRLHLPGLGNAVAGGGVFPHFKAELQLTEPGQQRSMWRLPTLFYPNRDAPPLSYHADGSRWRRDKNGVLLRTVGRGQEFVLDCAYYPKAMNWIKDILPARL